MPPEIPIVDVAPLFGDDAAARSRVDEALGRAARHSGFLVVTGVPEAARLDPERRRQLLQVLELPAEAKQPLYRQRYRAANPNRYRGLAPLRPSEGIGTENLDIGPDAVDGRARGDPRDVLCEPSPWPDERWLPGWRHCVARTFAGMESLGRAVVGSLERALALPAGRLLDGFADSLSTLTLARHPLPGELDAPTRRALAVPGGAVDELQLVLPHADSGCITFVGQDEGAGLQARAPDGGWTPVPAPAGGLAVNFGQLLENWTGGAVRATEHRVIGPERRRTAVVFFYEPAVDARIEALPGVPPFPPTRYGDYLWQRMQMFPDYQNLGERFREGPA